MSYLQLSVADALDRATAKREIECIAPAGEQQWITVGGRHIPIGGRLGAKFTSKSKTSTAEKKAFQPTPKKKPAMIQRGGKGAHEALMVRAKHGTELEKQHAKKQANLFMQKLSSSAKEEIKAAPPEQKAGLIRKWAGHLGMHISAGVIGHIVVALAAAAAAAAHIIPHLSFTEGESRCLSRKDQARKRFPLTSKKKSQQANRRSKRSQLL